MNFKALLFLGLVFWISVGINQKALSQEFYLDQNGDTLFGDLLRVSLGRLYFYDVEGNPKYINLEKIEGFKMGEEPYSPLLRDTLTQIRYESWLINSKPDSLYHEQIGFEGGVKVSFRQRNRYKGYTWTSSGYPFVYKRDKKYKNALGEIRILMPYVAITRKTNKLKTYIVGIGYTQSTVTLYENYSAANVELKDRVFYCQYESPLRPRWIKTKNNSKEMRYPLYGLGIGVNNKYLIYDKTESNEGSLGGSIFDKYYSELSYRDHSLLITFQTKLGAYWQVKSYYLKWGVNMNLVSYAHGRYYRREYYHSFAPDYETDNTEEGSYSTIVPITVKNSSLYLSAGIYID